jgi:hypothetical protein
LVKGKSEPDNVVRSFKFRNEHPVLALFRAQQLVEALMADNGSGVGTGLIAGILLVVVIAVGLMFATGKLNLGGSKDVNVKIEAPDLPKAPTGKE